jgi:hypothetical protein
VLRLDEAAAARKVTMAVTAEPTSRRPRSFRRGTNRRMLPRRGATVCDKNIGKTAGTNAQGLSRLAGTGEFSALSCNDRLALTRGDEVLGVAGACPQAPKP